MSHADRRRVLGLFAKQPLPGAVKTRLAADTDPAWAARVAEAFLLDTLDRLSAFAARRVLAFTPAAARSWFAEVVSGRFALVPQSEGDLGARMHAFFAGQFREGARAVVLLGTDSPTLPLDYVQQAFSMLETAPIVIGPAADGGYYLLGLAAGDSAWPRIFAGIPWGTAGVLQETVARLAGFGSQLSLLPSWYDVDTLADWRRLQDQVKAMRQAGLDPGAPRTEMLMGEG